jgi:nucleoid-associated protein YgaU
MKPLAVFSSLAVLCAGGLLALSYQGWQDDPSVVTAMTQDDQKVSIDAREAVSTPPAANAPSGQQPAATQTAAVQPGSEQAATSQETKSDSAQQPPAAADEPVPSFDIVRIEEDGSAVLAGRAAPGSTVTALLNGQAMGEAVANERGEWVLLPSQPLPAGAHEVTLSQAQSDGTVTQSGQSVALTVPDKPGTQPLIVLSETSKPSRVLQKPETEEAAAAAEPAKPEPAEEKVAAVEPAQTTQQAEQPAGGSSSTSAEPAQPAQEPSSTPAPAQAPAVSGTSSRSLTVDVVDYDAQGRTTFSGKAAPGSRVRIYVSDRFTGEAEADASGAWSITPSRDIAAGPHALRADLIGPDGNVGERIELPFLRESPERIAGLQADRTGAASTSEEPAKEPEPQQQAATEPQQEQPQTAAEPQPAEQAAAQPAQETAAAPANAEQPQGPGRVVIQPGNNLWQISRVIYGQGVQYTVIYEANKDQIRNPNLIYPGQILDTPGSNAPESIDPACRKPLAECKEEAKGAAQ